MIATTKALIAFCVLAVFGTVLVIGPDGLRRLLPVAPQSEVAKSSPQSTKTEPKVAETKPAAAADSKPAGPVTASSAPVTPAQPAKPDSKADPLTETRQATAALADLVPPSAPPAAGETGPRFDVARIDPDGVAVIAGRAAPGARVELLRRGETLDSAVADGGGQFVMTPSRLPSGQYELTLRAKTPDGNVTQSSSSVAVALSETAPRLAAATNGAVLPKSLDKNLDKSADRPAEKTKDQSKGESTLSANAVPATATEATTGALGASGASRIVSRGDSLWMLSRRAYGDGARYARIYNANRDKIHNPDLIYPGQTFVMPRQ